MNRKPSLFSRLMTGLIFLFLYAPIFVLIVFSFNDSKSRSVWAGFTLDWYDKLFHDQMILDALYTTLAVSVLASRITSLLLCRRHRHHRGHLCRHRLLQHEKALAHSADDGE